MTTTTDNWVDPDDAPKLDAAWFAGAVRVDGATSNRRGRPRLDVTKEAVSLRLDRDVLDWFRSSGPGWQTRMNDHLRKIAGL